MSLLLTLPLFSFIIATTLAVAAPLPTPRVKWLNTFPKTLSPESELHLQWTGPDPGESGWEVDVRPLIDGYQPMFSSQRLVPGTRETSTTWTVPALDDWPPDTKFVFCVDNGSNGPVENWFDCTDPIPLRRPLLITSSLIDREKTEAECKLDAVALEWNEKVWDSSRADREEVITEAIGRMSIEALLGGTEEIVFH